MNEPPPYNNERYEDIGPECFTDGFVISYKGENYYRACGAVVLWKEGGATTSCVKRVGHPGSIHEDYQGFTRKSGYAPKKEA